MVEVVSLKWYRIQITLVTSIKVMSKINKVRAKNGGCKSQRLASTFCNRVEVILITHLYSSQNKINPMFKWRLIKKNNWVLTVRSKPQKCFCKSWRQFPRVNVHRRSQQKESRLQQNSSGTTQERTHRQTLFLNKKLLHQSVLQNNPSLVI